MDQRFQLNMAQARADSPNDHIQWVNRVFFGVLYNDPKGTDDEGNHAECTVRFVSEWLEKDIKDGQGLGAARFISPTCDGWEDMSEEERKSVRYHAAFNLLMQFLQEDEETLGNTAWYDQQSLMEWVACGEHKHILKDGDIEWLEKVCESALAEDDEDRNFQFTEIAESETTEHEVVEEAEPSVKEQIIQNAVESSEEWDYEETPDLDAVIDGALTKAEKKAQARAEEAEDHDHGPDCNHGEEEHLEPPSEPTSWNENEWEPVSVAPITSNGGFVSWSAMAAVIEAQDGLGELVQKKPEFDKALVAAITKMDQMGILADPRCVLDAMLVMLQVDPRAVVKIEQIFNKANTEHGSIRTEEDLLG